MLSIITQQHKLQNIILPTVFCSLVILSSFPFSSFHWGIVQVGSKAPGDESFPLVSLFYDCTHSALDFPGRGLGIKVW